MVCFFRCSFTGTGLRGGGKSIMSFPHLHTFATGVVSFCLGRMRIELCKVFGGFFFPLFLWWLAKKFCWFACYNHIDREGSVTVRAFPFPVSFDMGVFDHWGRPATLPQSWSRMDWRAVVISSMHTNSIQIAWRWLVPAKKGAATYCYRIQGRANSLAVFSYPGPRGEGGVCVCDWRRIVENW